MNQLGFSHEFYDEYHKVHPRSSPYYDERQKLYELYHHLNVRFSFFFFFFLRLHLWAKST